MRTDEMTNERELRLDQPRTLSLFECAVRGGVGFGLASLCVFATVAFAEQWMYPTFGMAGAYAVWMILFIGLGGAALRPLYAGAALRFYGLFTLAFFAYAIAWAGVYFGLRSAVGERAASLLGSVLMATIFAVGSGAPGKFPLLSAVLFVTNSAGYFLGSALNAALAVSHRQAGMLAWGAVYGLFLGAGLGITLSFVQRRDITR